MPMVEFVLALNSQFQSNMKKYSAVADKVMYMTCVLPCALLFYDSLVVFFCSVSVFPFLVWPFSFIVSHEFCILGAFFQICFLFLSLVYLFVTYIAQLFTWMLQENGKMWMLKAICYKYLMTPLIQFVLSFWNVK